jgi:predicted aldo/keto reductase-like oxidoreductase
MIYRRFGKTGLPMPVLSFGAMRSMHSWQDCQDESIPDTSQTALRCILKTALAHGITHLETASGYGSSERQLGLLLPEFTRRSYLLQTKIVPEDDPDAFVASFHQSLRRLRVEYVDLLAIHGINDHRSLWQSCRKNGCLAAARALQDKGLARHIGFSGHGPSDVILAALTHAEDGGFDYFNVHWYYIFDANRDAIEYAAANDIGTFIISPSDKGGHLHTPSARLRELCAPYSPMLFNDWYCLSRPSVHTISVGAAEPAHFEEHLKVIALLESTAADDLSLIDSRLRHRMEQQTGFARPDHLWDELPPWDQAPGNINLRMVVWLYNLLRGWQMEHYVNERYAMLKGGSAWVPGNDSSRAAELDFSGLKGLRSISPDALKKLLHKAHQAMYQPPDPDRK